MCEECKDRMDALEETVKGLNEDVRLLTNVVYEMRQHIPGPVYSLSELPVRVGVTIDGVRQPQETRRVS